MGKFARHLDSVDPLGRQNRIKRSLEREIREERSAKRTRFADIGDEFTMTPEGPLPTAPMPTPDGLTITPDTEIIKVVWSGSADAAIPSDFGRLAVHVSKFSGYTPTQGTEVATVSSPYGGTALYSADGGDTYYVRCAIASLRGDYGPFTPEVAVTPGVGADAETFRGDVVGRSISIATVDAGGDVSETFSGSTWPTGWSHTWITPVPDGSVSAPVVTSTGVPTGSDNGSAILFDLGPAGGVASDQSGYVTIPAADVVDAEASITFQHTITPPTEDMFSASERLRIVLRGARSAANQNRLDRGIVLDLAQTNPRVREVTSWTTSTDLGDATYPTGGLVGGAWYNARLRAVGGRVEAVVWEVGAPEPDPAIFTASSVLSPGAVSLDWDALSNALGGATTGVDTYVDSVTVSRYATGFSVLPDGTARMTRAEIGTLVDDQGGPVVQSGSITVSVSAAATGTATLNFPTAFSSPPQVVLTTSLMNYYANVSSAPTTTGCGVRVNHRNETASDTATVTVYWLATVWA